MITSDANVVGLRVNFAYPRVSTCIESHIWNTVFGVPPRDDVYKQSVPATEL